MALNSAVRDAIVLVLLESDSVRNLRHFCQYRAASASVSTPERTANWMFARVSWPSNVSTGMGLAVASVR
eukprot:6456331-Pyramimonas_sp.AAC.1